MNDKTLAEMMVNKELTFTERLILRRLIAAENVLATEHEHPPSRGDCPRCEALKRWLNLREEI